MDVLGVEHQLLHQDGFPKSGSKGPCGHMFFSNADLGSKPEPNALARMWLTTVGSHGSVPLRLWWAMGHVLKHVETDSKDQARFGGITRAPGPVKLDRTSLAASRISRVLPVKELYLHHLIFGIGL